MDFKSENDIDPSGGVTDLALIDNEVYASSGGEVYKRIRNNKWQEIAHSVTGTFYDPVAITASTPHFQLAIARWGCSGIIKLDTFLNLGYERSAQSGIVVAI